MTEFWVIRPNVKLDFWKVFAFLIREQLRELVFSYFFMPETCNAKYPAGFFSPLGKELAY